MATVPTCVPCDNHPLALPSGDFIEISVRMPDFQDFMSFLRANNGLDGMNE
jgi:hypothetical protein